VKLFINYRREDTDDLAGRLYDRLTAEFGAENIFKDVDSIRPGQNWRVVLEQSVGGCDVVLALIGRHWLTCQDKQGRPRLQSDEDWVRFELEAAQRARRVVLPVLAKGTPVPSADELPESLRWLPEIHTSEVRGDPHFKDDVARLVQELRRLRDRLADRPPIATAAGGPAAGAEAASGTIACPKCGRIGPRTDQFCERCGASLWDQCPRCDKPVPANQRFCNHCGADVPKLKRAVEAFERTKARLHDLDGTADPVGRLRAAESLLSEAESAARQSPEHEPLAELAAHVRRTATQAAREAGRSAAVSGRLGEALAHYGRLASLDPQDPEGAARLREIADHREVRLAEAEAQFARGAHRKAAAILEALGAEFPDDAEVRDRLGRCRGVVDRAAALLGSGLRDLKARRQLVAMGREIDWLREHNVRAGGLDELAAANREKLAAADGAVGRAEAELKAGRVKAAIEAARKVLEAVADHEGALAIARQSGELGDRIDQLEEYVELGQWCAAHRIVRELEARKVSDPRLARLGARTRSAMGGIDFNIALLGAELVALIAAALFVVPWVATVLPPPERAGEHFYYYVWAGGGLLLLGVTWLVSEEKGQILRRVASVVPRPGAVSGRGTATATAPHPEAPGAAVVPPPLPPTLPPPLPPRPTPGFDPAGPTGLLDLGDDLVGEAKGEAGALSAAEALQRVEATAKAWEWVVLGGAAAWAAYVAAEWLNARMGLGWWTLPLWSGATALATWGVALAVGGTTRWRRGLGATAAGVALTFGLVRVLPEDALGWAALGTFLVLAAVIGLLSAPIFRVPAWRGAAASVGGPLGGALVASPLLIAGVLLLGLIVSSLGGGGGGGETRVEAENAAGPVVVAALTWCLLSVLASTASETAARYVVVNRPVIRGLFALGLALGAALGLVCLVEGCGLFLNAQLFWVTRWAVFVALAQFMPMCLRWRWRTGFSRQRLLASLATVGAVLLAEWVWGGSSYLIAAWATLSASIVLLNARTVDLATHGAEVWRRIRTRFRTRRLPIRIEVNRA
jgi:tetratricopeptide (TPR) repeat protein